MNNTTSSISSNNNQAMTNTNNNNQAMTPSSSAIVKMIKATGTEEMLSAAINTFDESKRVSVWEAIIQVYQEGYTDEEVNGIVAFYESPVGLAMARKAPAMMVAVGEAINKALQD